MKRLEKPIVTKRTIIDMEDMSYFITSLIFDDLLIIAQKETNCFVLKSTEGLILIDAIWPCEEAFNAIVKGIKDVGWNPNGIKKILITHGHADHTGCGKWIKNKYKAKAYLSKRDDIYWEEEPIKKNRPETWKDYQIDVYLEDGDSIILGDKKILVYETPGHTPGGLSFIFNVVEAGKNYMAALWGGTTPPQKLEGIVEYLKSLDYFTKQMEKEGVVVALSNHLAIDNGKERIAYSKKRMAYMPNIYVIGSEGIKNYFKLFYNLSYENLKKLSLKKQ